MQCGERIKLYSQLVGVSRRREALRHHSSKELCDVKLTYFLDYFREPDVNDPIGEEERIRTSTDQHQPSVEDAERKLRLFAEDLAVAKETVETGRLRVSKRTHARQAEIDEELMREEAIVETVPRGEQVFAMPVTRVEGDTTIIPVVVEVLHTEKRLVLKEEIRITRRRTTEHFHDTVTLRHQEAVVSRLQSATEPPGQGPENDATNTQE
jgi:uncharacterized protein (TIGR02271 family)